MASCNISILCIEGIANVRNPTVVILPGYKKVSIVNIRKLIVNINPFAHHSTPIAKITHATLSARINRPSIVGFKAIAP